MSSTAIQDQYSFVHFNQLKPAVLPSLTSWNQQFTQSNQLKPAVVPILTS